MRNYWSEYSILKTIHPLNKLITIKIIFCLLFFKFAVKFLPFSKLKAFYKSLTQTKKHSTYNSEQILAITNGIKVISRVPILKTNCLTQALTTKFLLRSVNHVVLIIGVSLENGFEAHAWVEKEGVYIIGDTPLTKFTPIWNWV